MDSFEGESYHTGGWPHEGVDFAGKRVAVIGTGSSGVQAIPVIAQQAGSVTVFQRTAQYTVPARHHTVDPKFINEVVKPNYDKILEDARWSLGGTPIDEPDRSALDVTAEERREIYEASWAEGGGYFIFAFNDTYHDRRANDTVSEFIRSKIRETVKDPETAEKLLPVDHPFGSKRALIDTDYFETYNRDNVKLVDIRHSPIQEITPKGIRTEDEEYEFDVIVFATGFDAMTGSYFKIDIRGKDGLPLKEKWAEGPKTYLGVQVAGFPNMFMITGPGSPSVLSNMSTSIEQHIEWISNLLDYMREREIETAEADAGAETAWVEHVNELADQTLYPLANSWYLGANIPGKPRVFTPYAGGVGTYRQKCNEVAHGGYEGFIFGPEREPAIEPWGITRPIGAVKDAQRRVGGGHGTGLPGAGPQPVLRRRRPDDNPQCPCANGAGDAGRVASPFRLRPPRPRRPGVPDFPGALCQGHAGNGSNPGTGPFRRRFQRDLQEPLQRLLQHRPGPTAGAVGAGKAGGVRRVHRHLRHAHHVRRPQP